MSFNNFSLNYTVIFHKLCDDLDIPSRTRSYCAFRLKNEGLKFLLVTLPQLNDLVLTALELGSLAYVKHDFTAFRWKRNALIHFEELICDIFDLRTGCVKSDPDPVALWRLRQLSLYFYKLNLSFTENQISVAEQKFTSIEEELSTDAWDNNFADKMRKNLESSYDFPTYDRVLSECRPRFGPGTFSIDSPGRIPYYIKKVTSEYACGFLKKFEAISGYFKLIPSYKNCLVKLPADTSDCSEVLFVPKDSRGPRTITREPLMGLKAQMSFFDYFSRFFENATHRRINFTDQQVNRNLAEIGSRTSSYATIDLKDASDRVSFSLVKKLSRNIPVLNYFLRFRTSEAVLPSGDRMRLSKLAGMGSGLTFVWLALICHTSIATEIASRTSLTFTEASKHVYVYGDDIIVCSPYVSYAYSALSKVGLLVNKKKSFTSKRFGSNSCFRESCGGDYFAGNDVGVTRLKLQNCGTIVDRSSTSLSFKDPSTAVSVVSAHAAELSLNGHNSLSTYLYEVIERVCGKLPLSRYPSSYLTRVTRQYIPSFEDSAGNHLTVSVLCSQPRIIDVDIMSPLWNYASSLKSMVDLDLHNLKTSSTSQFEMAVPRKNVLRRSRVSTYKFVG